MSNPDETHPPGKGQFLVYPSEDGRVKIEVRLENETVWLTQQHLADLFQTSKQNIGQHLKNIFEEGELTENSVVKNFFTTAADGKDYRTNYYNLDAIISVGYRVKSAVATRFRTINDRNTLTHAGKISHQMAKEFAEAEYDSFNRQRIQQADAAGGEFEKAIQQLPPPPKRKKGGKK